VGAPIDRRSSLAHSHGLNGIIKEGGEEATEDLAHGPLVDHTQAFDALLSRLLGLRGSLFRLFFGLL